MADVTLEIEKPSRSLTLLLGADPVATQAVELEAYLFDGEEDVSEEARFTWRLSWRGSYRTYGVVVAEGDSVVARFPVGGERLILRAIYRGRHHRASVPARIRGTNPTRAQVAARIGDDLVLQAICWAESTWRQFDARGRPLKNKGSTARGIAQVVERWWGRTTEIHHNDYIRIAWDWTYAMKAARDILTLCRARVERSFPSADEDEVIDRTIAAYHDGTRNVALLEDPRSHRYVKRVRPFMAERPWEE